MKRTRQHNAALKRLRLINERKAAKRALEPPPPEPARSYGPPWTWLATPPLRWPNGVPCDGSDLCFCVDCLPWGPGKGGVAIELWTPRTDYSSSYVTTPAGVHVVARRR